jgi:uncharacterized protein (DUF1501 family)
MKSALTRRSALGLGVAFIGSAAFAAETASRKLVMIICRGAMDGLSVAPPRTQAYYDLRGPIAIALDKTLPFDSDFGLHPKLVSLADMARSGEVRLAPAAAIPLRIRSHFEAQDDLETGGSSAYALSTGWLNRAVGALDRAHPVRALAVATQQPLILRGPAKTESWSPGGKFNPAGSRMAALLQDLYAHDALLGPDFADGLAVEAEAAQLNANGAPLKPTEVKDFATAAARFLSNPQGPAIAVLSLDGFDTHANQGAEEGQLAGRLSSLDSVLAGLKEGLGADWSRTVVVVATEFGRTAHVNGTKGTDHGTASTLILAGGALKPGTILGDWPGLAQGQLFENRDTAPTLDQRSVFKGVLIEHLGMDRRRVETDVFPDSGSARPVSGLIRA